MSNGPHSVHQYDENDSFSRKNPYMMVPKSLPQASVIVKPRDMISYYRKKTKYVSKRNDVINTEHILISFPYHNNRKDGIVLVRSPHGTEYSGSELVVGKGDRNGGYLDHGHQAGANQGSTD